MISRVLFISVIALFLAYISDLAGLATRHVATDYTWLVPVGMVIGIAGFAFTISKLLSR